MLTDDEGVPGSGHTEIVDMGAYEYRPTLYVYPDALGPDDGRSWETAFTDLQQALNDPNLAVGDEIHVAVGTYTPTSCDVEGCTDEDRQISFTLVNGVSIMGGYVVANLSSPWTATRPAGSQSVLSGDIGLEGDASDNSYHVIRADDTIINKARTVLHGFKITGGKANGTSPDERHGGGLHADGGSPTLRNCAFAGNSADATGGGMVCSLGCRAILNRCDFIGNSAPGRGGGLYILGASTPMLTDCSFADNSAYAGGALAVWFGSPTLTNCVFTGNASSDGGAVLNWGTGSSAFTMTNCSLPGNSATNYGGGIYNAMGNLTLTNSILWGNSDSGGLGERAQLYTPFAGPTGVTYTLIQGLDTFGDEPTNKGGDPLFVDLEDDNVLLKSGSPCIDAGDNTAVVVAQARDGAPRFVDDPATVDTGNCSTPNCEKPIVDMGAYEFCPLLSPTEASPPHDARKNRYISITPGTTCGETALQVKLTSMKRCSLHPSRACEADSDCGVCSNDATIPCISHSDCGPNNTCGDSDCDDPYDTEPLELGWVSEPYDASCFKEDGTSTGDPCTNEFIARVVGAPVFRTWTEGTVHVGDCEIVPVAEYEIRTTPDEVVFSDPLAIETIQKPDERHYGDVAGIGTGAPPPTPGWEPPNGVVNVSDVQAFLLTVQGPTSPSVPITWVDLHGSGMGKCSISGTTCWEHEDCGAGESCVFPAGSPPNFVLNVADLQRILFGFEGKTYAQSPGHEDPRDCAATTYTPPSGDPVTFSLVPTTDIITSAESVDVDVYVDSVDDLGAFELALEVTGGTSGELTLVAITVDSQRQDYVFGSATAYEAKNMTKGSLSNSLESGSVQVTGTGYLATYTYQPTGGASGVFTITVKGDEDSFLNKGDGVMLATQTGGTQVIGVGIDCFDTADCSPISCQTPTCNNYACIYTNLAQGTPCDDGQFCTATDECDGNGTCVGSGTPCPPPRNPQCCEGTDQCICSTCMCPQ